MQTSHCIDDEKRIALLCRPIRADNAILTRRPREVNTTSTETHQSTSSCPMCRRPFEIGSDFGARFERNYFGSLLSKLNRNFQKPDAEYKNETGLSSNSFNQGYYSRFFREGRRLGHGVRGTVFVWYLLKLSLSSQHLLDDVELGVYAVKKIPVGNNHRWLVAMLNEVNALERLSHPNIISYKHTWIEMHRISDFGPEVPSLFMLMELATGGSVEDWINNPNRLNHESFLDNGTEIKFSVGVFDTLSKLLIEFVNGLVHIHHNRIVHRDLKPSNLLLMNGNSWSHPGRLVISDFGECIPADSLAEPDSIKEFTPEYAAPELLEDEHAASFQSDIWSAGMIIYELITGRYFEEQTFNLPPVEFGKDHLAPYWDIIKLCLSKDPTDRPSADKLLQMLLSSRERGLHIFKSRQATYGIRPRKLLEYTKKKNSLVLIATSGVIGVLILGLALGKLFFNKF